jgi:predicted nucleic acid-binding Zn ribbon protein
LPPFAACTMDERVFSAQCRFTLDLDKARRRVHTPTKSCY